MPLPCRSYIGKKIFQNVMLVGMVSKVSKKYTHTSVWITQDTMDSREPRLNVHASQILAHTFSHDTLDSIVYMSFLLISLAIPTNITF